MTLYIVKNRSWGVPTVAETDFSLEKGDVVIGENEDGTESAIVEEKIGGKKGLPKKLSEDGQMKFRILRKASLRDINAIRDLQKKEKEALDICRGEVKKNDLPMKMVNCHYAFDGGSITFSFIADGRIDFRDLVKNLSRTFQRSIRLHQVGARDEARNKGGYGICGRELCCIRFQGDLPSISSDMAKAQQIIRRGSERISGICGRLMCCLAYEAQQYQEALAKMPQPGSEIKVEGKIGRVKEVHALEGNVTVEFPDKSITIVKP